MEDARVIVQNKTERGFLFLFFGVLGLLAGVRGITGDGAAAQVFGAVFAIVGLACAVYWVVLHRRPPGRLEISAAAITQWRHGDRWERITPGPIRVYQTHLNGQPGIWQVEGVGRPMEVGQGTEVLRTVEVPMGLLGYHPGEVQQACAGLGWTVVDRDGNPQP